MTNEKGNWPEPMVYRRIAQAPSLMRGYGSEDSFGISPNYTNRSIYFASRK